MPAPTQSDLEDALIEALPAVFKDDAGTVTGEQAEWTSALTQAMHEAWTDWQDAITGGGLTVSGSGTPTWTGTGEGGSLSEGTAMEWASSPSFGKTQELTELKGALAEEVKQRFATWVGDYSFSGASYEGTSTATSSSSGTFDATAVGTEVLSAIGSGTQPSAVKSDVLSSLEGKGWKPGKEEAKIGQWLGAFDAMLSGQFQAWLGQTKWIDNTVQGPSAAGSGSGTGTSNNDGGLN